MKINVLLGGLMTAAIWLAACGQVSGQTSAPAAMPPVSPAGPIAAVAPEVRDILKKLQDRKQTLRDFTARIDYSVHDPVTDDTGGKRGMVDFLMDPNKGPIFTVDFTEDTDSGKVVRKHHQQVLFDGQDLVTKDFEGKQFTRSNILKPGEKPGSAVTLGGPLPLPIGLDVEDVVRDFDVTITNSDADQVTLKLAPRASGKFDFRQLEVTVDKKLELPIKLVQTAKNKDVITITLQDIQPNSGKARMQDSSAPPSAGWIERKP